MLNYGPMFRKEREIPRGPEERNLIVPVFGGHVTGNEEEARLRSILDGRNTGQYPDIHAWPSGVSQKVRELNPQLLALDSLSGIPDVDPSLLFFLSPGNPFKLRSEDKDLFIMGGDITNSMWKEPFIREPITRSAVTTYLNSSDEYNVEDINNLRKRIYIHEAPFVILAAAIFALSDDLKMEAAGFLPLFTDLLRARLNQVMRGVDNPSNDKLYARIMRLSKPFWRSTNAVDFRDAIIAMKLSDSQDILERTEEFTGPSVALTGTWHAAGKNLWNNRSEQERVVGRSFDKMLRMVQKLENDEQIVLSDESKEEIVRDLSHFFGVTTIYRVLEDPQSLEVLSLMINIPLHSFFISRSVSDVVAKTAEKTGFLLK